MDIANLTAKYEDYESNIGSMLELVDVYKDTSQKSKESIVALIEEATAKASELLSQFKAELIKDTVSHLNTQIRDYELYEDSLNSTLQGLKESMQETAQNPQLIRETTIKLNKARYGLEKPVQKVFSFIEQWEDLSRCDIGILVSDIVHEDKPSPISDKKAVKKKLQKHQAVRLPLMKGSAPTTPSAFKFPQTTPNAISSANSTPEVKRTKMAPPPNNHSFLTSTAINNDSQNCHESKSDELISKANGSSVSCEDTTELLSTQGPTSDEVDLIISAVNEWSLVTNESPNLSLSLTPLAAQVPIADTATNQNSTATDNSTASSVFTKNVMATVAPPPAASPLPAPDSGGGEEAWGESEADAQWVVVDETMGDTSNAEAADDTPSIDISFSSLTITSKTKQEVKPIKPEPFLPPAPSCIGRSFGADLSNTQTAGSMNEGFCSGGFDAEVKPAVKMEKDVRSLSAVCKFLASGGKTDVMNAKLANAVGGRALNLQFPIGACTFAGGLVVCNSGDGKVVHFEYKNDGTIFNKTYISGRFQRPSAVTVDKTGSLFVKDDTCIRRYSSKFTLEKMFPECPRRPYGLALTDDNTLVTMCDCGNGRGVPKDPCLLEYNIDGTLKHTIKLKLPLMVSTKLRFMDVYGEFIFISDLGASYVFKVNRRTGELIKTIAEPGRKAGTFNEPSGITCDKNGYVLIGDSRSNRIQIFDGKEGVYKTMLSCQGGLTRPSGIYLAPDDKLYVVNYLAHRVQIYDLQG